MTESELSKQKELKVYKCSACGKKHYRDHIHKHHIEYYSSSDLEGRTILLCEDCHRKIHQIIKLIYRTPRITNKRLEVVTNAVLQGWPKDKLLTEARTESKSVLSVKSKFREMSDERFWKKVERVTLSSRNHKKRQSNSMGWKLNPKKRWQCTACFKVYLSEFLDRAGGICPSCGNDEFDEYDKEEEIYLWEIHDKRLVGLTGFDKNDL